MIHSYRLAFTDSITTAFRPCGAAGRWHSRGVVVVYTAEHPALAALELLAAWDDYADFSRYHLYRCTFSRDAVSDALADFTVTGLDVQDKGATQPYGDHWTANQESPVLRVPSVVVPASYNYLLNPDHPDFDRAMTREALGPFRYDA